jgi:DNA (cytosine-5)-methyltransferase 1
MSDEPSSFRQLAPLVIRHGSLFSGIGGFDLAAQWAGWENVFQVEIDNYYTKVLEKNFPNAKRYRDIREFDGTRYRGTIDVVSGGFPCQPFSIAGKREGKEDDRYLWPEMLRVLRQIKPTWIVGENVAHIVKMELGNILADLELLGYETQAFLIPATSVDAKHKRERVWIVANTKSLYDGESDTESIDGQVQQLGKCAGEETLANTAGKGLQRQRKKCELGKGGSKIEISGSCETLADTKNAGIVRGIGTQTNVTRQTGRGRRASSFQRWKPEPGMDRMVDGVPNKVDRIKGLGNAIVPQVAFEIFRAIAAVSV